jgi:hypothetical protein
MSATMLGSSHTSVGANVVAAMPLTSVLALWKFVLGERSAELTGGGVNQQLEAPPMFATRIKQQHGMCSVPVAIAG